MTPKSCITLLVFLVSFSSFAQYGNLEFIENKGQWDPRVRFKSEAGAGAFFVRSTGFTVVQHNQEDWNRMNEAFHPHTGKDNTKHNHNAGNTILRSHAYAVDFIDAAGSPQIVPDKVLPTYNNYFIGNDPSRWAANCKIYLGVTMKEIYPGVDLRYYTESGYLKYDIIAKPGADINKIALRYAGADGIEVKNKELRIKTSVGTIKELYPYSYQFDGQQKKEIPAKFVVNGNVVKFEIKNYDPAATLVIDPTIIFSSFSRSSADNWGFTATYDAGGNFYGGGIVMGTGFPVSTGAFQSNWGGGSAETSTPAHDIGIIKLSPDGSNRVYATYIGGSENEQPNSLVVDAQGNLVVAGRTGSGNYPLVPAGNQQGPGGGKDIIITKLNATGTALIGSMRIGGTGNDGVNISINRTRNSLQQNYGDDGRSEVILDGAGNIYVASNTQSTNFPVTGGFQATNGGNQDAVLIKLSPNVNVVQFSTYMGGSGDDAAYVLALGPGGSIYAGGGTTSANFPGITTPSIGTTYQGGVTDGYVAVVANDGSSILRATFIGTPGIDQVYGVQFDDRGFPYVMGQTTGAWPVINAAYSSGGKQFIAKLQPDLSAYVYSTTFGTGSASPNISPVAFLVDRCENVYVSGWGGDLGSNFQLAGTAGLPTTPDAFKSTTDDNDMYFFVLAKNATSQLFGSFFGQTGGVSEHVDGGTSRFDRNGVIYQAICANCGGGATYPIVGSNPWGPTNPSNNCNLGMLKIAFNLAGVGADVQASIGGVVRDTAGCVPLTVCFRDSIQNAVSYEWNFGDNTPQVTTTRPDTCHTFTAVGNYQVMLVAIDSNTCNIRDTSYVTIRVGSLEVLPRFTTTKLNPCDSFKYRFDNISFQPPSKPFQLTSFTWDFGDGSPRFTTDGRPVFHQYTAPGTYNVKLIVNDTNYCNAPDSITVPLRVAPFVEADFDGPTAGCAPFTATFTNTSLGGVTFNWDFGDGGVSTDVNPVYTFNTPGTYTVTLIAIDSGTCNIVDTFRTTIVINSVPVADFSFSPDPPVLNTPTVFSNLSSPDAIRFRWDFGDGDTLLTTSRAPVLHQYNATGTFNACLVAYNAAGCTDTVCKQVRAQVEPVLDVPNAFTPQSGGINSVVMPRGFGIAKIRFIIYNRWGQKMFETTSRNTGWDGKYKGVLQPMDVYAYTLEVDFFDGTKASKRGDITLIR